MPRRPLLLVAVLVGLVGALPAPATAETSTARALLSRLPVAAESGTTTYERTAFRHWSDADRDCRSTRAEVLAAESRVAVAYTSSSGCTVATGRWYSYYDGLTWSAAGDVDVDHVVALKEAWESGARGWTAERRERYANDLAYGRSLIAVTDDVNASKGDRDPAQWLPPRSAAHCRYATTWALVKYRWRLSVDAAERDRLASLLAGDCGAAVVTVPSRVA